MPLATGEGDKSPCGFCVSSGCLGAVRCNGNCLATAALAVVGQLGFPVSDRNS